MPNLLVPLILPILALQSQPRTATEVSLGAAAALSRETFLGADLGLARRTSNESRVALALAAGGVSGGGGDEAAARGPFGRLIVSGPHASALLLGLTATHFSQRCSPLGLEFTVRFVRAIPVDTTLVRRTVCR